MVKNSNSPTPLKDKLQKKEISPWHLPSDELQECGLNNGVATAEQKYLQVHSVQTAIPRATLTEGEPTF